MSIKPIETFYNGYKFRSRLEARWAVFLDALGVKYEYEPEGFNIDGTKYLPDFYLPNVDRWLEVKGKKLSSNEVSKINAFCEANDDEGNGLLFNILFGEPTAVFLSDILPMTDNVKEYAKKHDIFIGVKAYSYSWKNSDIYDSQRNLVGHGRDWMFYIPELVENEKDANTRFYPTTWRDCEKSAEQYLHAIEKARQARFEHGECG